MKKTIIYYLLLFAFSWSLSIQANTPQIEKQTFHQWASTPPMGWNSWDCFGTTVTEEETKANADYMAKYLKPYGWQYIVVDIRWYVENNKEHGAYNQKDPIFVMDEYGRLLPTPLRFPTAANSAGFKPLADYIHSKGLKFGIHIMRGIPKEAVAKNTPIKGTTVKASEIYDDKVLCKWLRDMYSVDSTKKGAQEYYNSLFELYASWGVDFVKVDDLSRPYHGDEIDMIRKAIDRSGRKILLSTSPGETPIVNANHVANNANMWRIIDDFWDKWPQLKLHFDLCNRWAPYSAIGHYPDCDMLPMGKIGIRAERGKPRMSAFTHDELYTMMTLWSIFKSPLMFGGNLPDTDPFSLSLLTNKNVLEVNQHSTNNRQVCNKNWLVAWTADDPKTGDKYVALFNAQDPERIDESKALWKSESITMDTPDYATDIDVNIAGLSKLYLVTSDNESGSLKYKGAWIDPMLIGDKDTLRLQNLKWNSSLPEAAVDSNKLKIVSGSIIEYTIPKGYNRFVAKGKLNDVKPETWWSNMKYLVYSEQPQAPIPADSSVVSVQFLDLGLKGTGKYYVKDLWTGKNLGQFSGKFSKKLPRHGAGLYRISSKKQ